MIRPSVAPIKPKVLKESDISLDEPFLPSLPNQQSLMTTRSPTIHYNEELISAGNTSLPSLIHIETERSGRIFQKAHHLSDKNNEKLYSRAEMYVQSLFESFKIQNAKEIRNLRRDIEQIGLGIKELTRKCDTWSHEYFSQMIAGQVSSLLRQQRLVFGREAENRFQKMDEKMLKIQQHYLQNMEKAYMEVKEITVCMESISSKVEYLEQENRDRERIKGNEMREESRGGDGKSSRFNFSKINLEQPQSILSRYQRSEILEIQENRQPSTMKKLENVVDASSQMILIGEQGSMTDIKGLPILDNNGNLIILNLKQIRQILHQSEPSANTDS